MDVLMGLIAAVCWGVTDYLVSLNGRALGVQRSVFYSQFIGLIILSSFMVISSSGLHVLFEASLETILVCIIAAMLTFIGAICLTKALSQGRTSVVAPLITSYGMVTTILAWFGGELLTGIQVLGIAICMLGIWLVGVGHGKTVSRANQYEGRAIIYALLAAGLYGCSFWVQGKYALKAVGPINMLWLTYFLGVVFLLFALRKGEDFYKINIKACGTLSAASVFNLGGFAAFALGALEGSVAIVTVISTLSGGVAAVLGYFFYKERLVIGQLSGVLLVILGAVVLHAF
ncbi:DMT family transporter [Pseudomonas sp. NPDC089547]|uniref:DMT family transporter n=1 Tax=Pseudomonas sp. NPDC089547 TaxID=3390652 RepID=UPI003D073822